jgi:transcriptional regulator with XRE-family HTH domain
VPTADHNLFGERLSEAIERSGKSQTALAAALGVTPNTICNWKRGASTPRLESLRSLSDLLDVRSGWLMGSEPQSKPSSSTPERLTADEDPGLLNALAALEGAEPQLRELVDSIPRLIEAVRDSRATDVGPGGGD